MSPSAELRVGAGSAPEHDAANGSKLFQSMPVLGLLLAFDTRWRLFRDSHRRNEGVAELHELFRELSAEIHRLGLVEQFTGRFSFDGDAAEAFARCLELARGAGLQWPEIVEIVNRAGEAGKLPFDTALGDWTPLPTAAERSCSPRCTSWRRSWRSPTTAIATCSSASPAIARPHCATSASSTT